MLLFLTAAASLLDDRSLVLKRQQADQILLFCGMYFILWLLLDSFNDYFFFPFSLLILIFVGVKGGLLCICICICTQFQL